MFECPTSILQRDDAARQAFTFWKGSARLVSGKNAIVTGPVIMPLDILSKGDRQANTESIHKWKLKREHYLEITFQKSSSMGMLWNIFHVP